MKCSYSMVVGYCLNRFEKPAFMAVPKYLPTDFGICHSLKSCVFHFSQNRFECIGGGTPRSKVNSTGPIKGVIGGSYSSVSIQV